MKTASCQGLIALCLTAVACAPNAPVPATRPVSHEARLVEVASSAEWLVSAAGQSTASGKTREADATWDAKYCAVHFVLLGGTDPLLQTERERRAFEDVRFGFFEPSAIGPFITWESLKLSERVLMEGGRRLKVRKEFRINREALRQEMIRRGILSAPVQALLPVIMVVPRASSMDETLRLLDDPVNQAVAAAIESHLTARHFEVRIPQQNEVLDQMQLLSGALAGLIDDPQQALALNIGSDVYVSFQAGFDRSSVAGSPVNKAHIAVQAFETSTAKALGTETGYSQSRPVSQAVLAEEAVNAAIANVISRMERYWKDDQEGGAQYVLILKFGERLGARTVQSVQDDLAEDMASGGWARHYREEILTGRNSHYRVWCSADAVRGGRALAERVEKCLARHPSLQVERLMVNRKLVIVRIS